VAAFDRSAQQCENARGRHSLASRITMRLPFTTDQFFDVFRQYNTSVWPMQIVMTAFAVVAVVLAARGRGSRLVSSWLAAQWAWTGVVYHWLFFAGINGAARLFAALWLAGGLAFAWNASRSRALSFRAHQPLHLAVGGVLVVYALVVYPIFGYLDGRIYPASPTFGAPCPVTILTIGLLWLARPPVARYLLVAPLLWAAVGSSAAFTLGVREDLGLLVAGVTALLLLLPTASSRPAAVERL
jgi:hypothetical protein